MPKPLAFFVARACLALAAVGALAGCATRAPAVHADAALDTPAAWRGAAPGGSESLARWWRVFDDVLLVQLVQDALDRNTEVRTAQANLRRAQALREVATAALWPTLSAAVSAQHARGAGAPASSDRFEAGFDAAWDIDAFGANRHGAAASRADVQASAAALGFTQVSIAAEVALGYLQWRGTQARIAIARDSLASQQQTLQIALWREQAGLASSLEAAQARGAVAQTRAQLAALEAAAVQSRHALAVLAGQPPAALEMRLSARAPLPQPARELAAAIPAQVLRQRADVAAAQHQLEAAAERVAQADAARRPSLRLNASLAWSALTLGSLGSVSAARSLLAGAGQTLFDAGRLGAQRSAAEAAFDAAEQAYRARVLGALQQVEDALADLAGSRERLAALQEAAAAVGQASLLARQRYASGLIDFQTVLETQRNLLNVQDGVASAQTELAAGHVRLYRALGGGWNGEGAV